MLRFLIVPTRNLLQTGECLVASGAIHVILIATALVATQGSNGLPGFDREIVPLFLIPPDRIVETPSESRLPIFTPFGNEHGTGNRVVEQAEHGEARLSGGIPARQPGTGGDFGLLTPGIRELNMDSVFSVIAVDSAVTRFAESVAPLYPPDLVEQGIEGEVFAEFVVDTTGSVDTTTIRILETTHPEFAASVRDALPRMLFHPAIRNLRKVRQLVQQRFRFQIRVPVEQTS